MKRILFFICSFICVLTFAFLLVPKSEAGAETASDSFDIEGTTLVGYSGTSKEVIIPNTVKTIGRSAFERNSTMERVVISDSVETIEPYAFWGCTALENVSLGDGLYEVGDFTFSDCPYLSTVLLSDSIRRIGIMSFADCPSLLNISISMYVNDIHETAFDGNKNLTIQAEEGSYGAEYAKEFARKQQLMGDVEIPVKPVEETPAPTTAPAPVDETTGNVLGSSSIVGNLAFVFMDNTKPNLGEGEFAPVERENPSDVKSQSDGTIVISGGVLEQWSLYGNEDITEVVLPSGTTLLSQFSFARSSVSKVVLPEGLTRIEYAAFYHCDNLREVNIPSTVSYIGEKAFTHTPWYDAFMDRTDGSEGDFLIVGDGILLAYRGTSQNVVIPDTVKYIGEEVFLNHTEIRTIVVPETVESVASSAFRGCTNLINM